VPLFSITRCNLISGYARGRLLSKEILLLKKILGMKWVYCKRKHHCQCTENIFVEYSLYAWHSALGKNGMQNTCGLCPYGMWFYHMFWITEKYIIEESLIAISRICRIVTYKSYSLHSSIKIGK
jgi:hypothetical protein